MEVQAGAKAEKRGGAEEGRLRDTEERSQEGTAEREKNFDGGGIQKAAQSHRRGQPQKVIEEEGKDGLREEEQQGHWFCRTSESLKGQNNNQRVNERNKKKMFLSFFFKCVSL